MKSRFLQILVVLLALAVAAFAQTTRYNYQFAGAFPDTGFKGPSGAHGVAVDPEGKVWIQLFTPADSISVAGVYKKLASVHVFNANKSAAAFSPIRMVTVGATTDTLYAGNNRGIAADKNGNIVFTDNLASPTRNGNVFRVNYKTGVGMTKVVPQTTSLGMPAFTSDNDMVIGTVLSSAGPIRIFDQNFAPLGNVVDTSRGFSRCIGVSADGNDVYWTSYTQPGVIVYHSNNGTLGPYTVADTIMWGMTVESITWHPVTKYLWVSTGNGFAPSVYDSVYTKTKWGDFTFYAFKTPITRTSTPVDSFKINGANTTIDPRPRGIAFSPTGDTVYVAQFNASGFEAVQRFIGSPTQSVEKEEGVVATDYQLLQNYPNPFNPSTQIKFTLANSTTISLKVYDVLGKEVAVLAEGAHSAGAYSVRFEAQDISAGMYFYTLRTSEGFVQTKKMLLLK